jgi:hypothetical protein
MRVTTATGRCAAPLERIAALVGAQGAKAFAADAMKPVGAHDDVAFQGLWLAVLGETDPGSLGVQTCKFAVLDLET